MEDTIYEHHDYQMDDFEDPSDQLYSKLEDSVSNLVDSLTHKSSGLLSLACTSTSLAEANCSPSVDSMLCTSFSNYYY